MAKPKKPPVMVSKFLRDAVNARLDDPASGLKVPTLLECLLPVYEGNKLVRAAGKLSIAPEGAHWRVKLDCPTEIISTSMAVASLVDIFDELEAYLASGKAVWSPGWKKNGRQLPTVDDLLQ